MTIEQVVRPTNDLPLHQKLISMLLSMLRKRMAELNSTVNFHGTIIIKLDR